MKNTLLVLLVLLILVTSCSFEDTPPSVLNDSSCQLPCWNNIMAGKTTKDEFLSILSTLQIVDQNSVTVTSAPWKIFDDGINFDLYPNRRQWSLASGQRAWVYAQARILDNVIADLSLCGNLGATFGQVVKATGGPEKIIALRDPFTGGIWISAIMPIQGVEISYNTKSATGQTSLELAPETQIGCLDLFDPNMFDAMADAGLFSMGSYNAAKTFEISYPWSGYGNIEEKYPPRSPKQP